MKNFLYISILSIFLLSGCSQKIKISALKPAQIDEISQYKKIAVSSFSNDKVAFSDKLESKLAHIKAEDKFFFTVIGRKDIDEILEEQKLQLSGLIDKSSAVKIGELLGAQAIIGGNISNASLKDTLYYTERKKCLDKKCKKYKTYNVRCTKRTISLSAEIKILSVEDGSIIYGDTLSKSDYWNHCSDRSNALPSKEDGLNSMANSLTSIFVKKLAPYYTQYYVEILDTPEIDYTDKQEQLLENALVYLEHKRYKKAEQLLSKLLDSTSDSCYVAAYNLGLIKEKNGELKKANQLYALADSLTIEPNEALDKAIIRVKSSIHSRSEATRQIKQ